MSLLLQLALSLEDRGVKSHRTQKELVDLFHLGGVYRVIIIGVYLGYPFRSIEAFINRLNDISKNKVDKNTPTSKGTIFDGSGFIPSKEDKHLKPATLIEQINRNRFCEVPFDPTPGSSSDVHQIDTKVILKLLNTNHVFGERVNEMLDIHFRN